MASKKELSNITAISSPSNATSAVPSPSLFSSSSPGSSSAAASPSRVSAHHVIFESTAGTSLPVRCFTRYPELYDELETARPLLDISLVGDQGNEDPRAILEGTITASSSRGDSPILLYGSVEVAPVEVSADDLHLSDISTLTEELNESDDCMPVANEDDEGFRARNSRT